MQFVICVVAGILNSYPYHEIWFSEMWVIALSSSNKEWAKGVQVLKLVLCMSSSPSDSGSSRYPTSLSSMGTTKPAPWNVFVQTFFWRASTDFGLTSRLWLHLEAKSFSFCCIPPREDFSDLFFFIRSSINQLWRIWKRTKHDDFLGHTTSTSFYTRSCMFQTVMLRFKKVSLWDHKRTYQYGINMCHCGITR